MDDTAAAAAAAVPARAEGAAEAAPAAPRSPPRRRLTGPGPSAVQSSTAARGSFAQEMTGMSAVPPPAVLQQTQSADYASSRPAELGSQFGRSTRSEEVQAGALARALLAADQGGGADDGLAAGSPDDAGEPRRARRLTGGRRGQLPPRSASVEGELPAAAADGPRGDATSTTSPTRRQGSLQPTMNGHLTLTEVRLLGNILEWAQAEYWKLRSSRCISRIQVTR